MRVALARVLLENPDIMLLDEPTNYLDLEARSWLESFLASYSGGVLIVSHDRYFLDVTVKEVYELFGGKLTRLSGNIQPVRESQVQGTRRDLRVLGASAGGDPENWRISSGASGTRLPRLRRCRAGFKMLEKIVPIEIPEGMKHIHFAFPPAPHSGKVAVRIENLTKSYGRKQDHRGFRRRDRPGHENPRSSDRTAPENPPSCASSRGTDNGLLGFH